MAKIYPGMYTARIEGPFIVFLIGMRINKFFAVRRWMSVAASMGPMMAELQRQPELGLLHFQTSLNWRGVMVTQYWRSFDHLHAYAHARNAKHLPAWAEFNRRIGSDGSVGIWHETYSVQAGNYETVYGNMPRFGLANAGEHVPAVGRLRDARSRINAGSNEN